MYNQTRNSTCSYSYSYPALDQLELELEASNPAGYCASSSSSSYGGSPALESLSLGLGKASSSSLDAYAYALPEDSNSQNAPVRRVFSSGDLQSVSSYMAMRRGLQGGESNENSLIIEGILKATKYTPQQKQERIERYRSKRNQRNFRKKIQYTCRKTLADSRPRVKGRFVSTSTSPVANSDYVSYDGESSSVHQHQHQHEQYGMSGVRGDLEDEWEQVNYNWVNLIDCPLPFPSQYEH